MPFDPELPVHRRTSLPLRVTTRQLKIPPRFRPALTLMCASCEPLTYKLRATTPTTAVDSYAGRLAKWRVALPNRGIWTI
jgi:hypothetical protein